MKPCRSTFTMAIYVLSTLLFMTLLINTSEDKIIFDSQSEQDDLEEQMNIDENQTIFLGLDLNILNYEELNDVNAQNPQEDELQTPESTLMSPFDSIKKYILHSIFYQFLTIRDMMNIRNTCSYFQRLLSPNNQTMCIYGQMFLMKQICKFNTNVHIGNYCFAK